MGAVRAVKNDVLKVEVDRVHFRDGGSRAIVPLRPEQWEDVPFQDPCQFIAAVLNLFMDSNRIGTTVVGNLLQIRYKADQDGALKYFAKPSYWRGMSFLGQAELAVINGLMRSRRAVPDYMVVVLANLLGIPEDVFIKRASVGTDRRQRHVTQHASGRALPKGVIPERMAAVRNVFGDVPLRRPLADREMWELATRLSKALAPK